MTDLQTIISRIKAKVAENGGNQSEVARQLKMSSQLLGRYIRGTEPGITFGIAWRNAYGEDLTANDETKVSDPNSATEQSSSGEMNTQVLSALSLIKQAAVQLGEALEKQGVSKTDMDASENIFEEILKAGKLIGERT